MLYLLHGDNQKDLKDYIFDLKKRAPLVEEFDARLLSWEEFISHAQTSTFLFAPQKKEHARLIVVSGFTKSTPAFQKALHDHVAALAKLPDVILFYEDDAIKDRATLELFKKEWAIKRFDCSKKQPSRDPRTPYLFECVNAWARGDRNTALAAAHMFFEHGGSAEALFFVLASYVKKTKKPYTMLRALRDQFIASRLEKAHLCSRLVAFLAR